MVTRENWQEQIKLARYENVYIESGGITWLFNEEFYPYPSAVEAIKEAASLVGWHKLMWGSDYPRTMTAITYKMSLDFIEKTREISEENKKLILGENAVNFYGFGPLPIPEKIKNMVE
jgi:predicted TIM-barrel fold metal-dependent hydrolase